MNPTDEAVAKATAELDDKLEPVSEPSGDDKKPTTPDKDETPEEGKEHKDEGYSADELEEPAHDEPSESAKDVKVDEIDTSGLTPEARYIVENLPYMTARVMDNGSVRELQVKSWTQLPENVTFATKRDELAFMNALTAQENRALALQARFQQDQQQQQSKDFEERENRAIRDDIAKLQRNGDLPKFKANPDDPDFSKDEATKEVQKILTFMEDRNRQYFDEYQQGRPFKHIGFEEAYNLYVRQNGSPSQRQEDKERKEKAGEIGGGRGMATKELKRPRIRAGTTVGAILDRIDTEDW